MQFFADQYPGGNALYSNADPHPLILKHVGGFDLIRETAKYDTVRIRHCQIPVFISVEFQMGMMKLV